MNPFMMLAAVAADWPRLGPLLDPYAHPALRTLLAELRTGLRTHDRGRPAEGEPAEADRRAADRAVRAVLDALPDHEAARLRGDGGTERFAGTSPSAVHEGFDVMDLCMLVIDGNPMVGPLLGPVRERLLRAPASSPRETGPTDPRLIVLTRENGERQLPAFQFEAGAMPWEVVLEVADVLRADRDPWGAADWWLSANAWTGTPPAGLLGQSRDPELLGAARALTVAGGEW
ncbi:hypothetical protein OG978_28655 [Streptomyces sp. NBC_01591]|uniref:hypothetical protein n=1 Tax=Streptomyces sp. NBC_01591 TaxID=2975888 RepID=UPI002DDA5FA9|nr:hypothetical protein [Streptomyces sp. NBC_01591]WSD71009.1 hypothetical protein OG978_28655 [Streptomyces sp. NBC_01591]